MISLESIDPIAAWGAALSTILALVKFWEQRVRLDFSFNWTGSEIEGNEVVIRNLGSKPVFITSWELLWIRDDLFAKTVVNSRYPDWDDGDRQLAGYSSTKIGFCEGDYFCAVRTTRGGQKIYLKLFIAGRSRPIMRKIFPRDE